jgi:nitroimidazol reductase NimA-like FMN-containing flavoprotein (pyridoxamine 5'-phosphate oxidase superfamily)
MVEPVELSGSQCLELLERHGVGRVAFSTPMGPRIVPVRYTLEGSEIVFPATPYSEVGTYAPDSEVAFEIDDADAAGHCGCTVVALGRAEVVETSSSPPGQEGGPDEPDAPHEGYRWIKVSAHDLTGSRLGD